MLCLNICHIQNVQGNKTMAAGRAARCFSRRPVQLLRHSWRDSYVSLNFHLMDDESAPRNFVTACQATKQEHSANNLRGLSRNAIEERRIPASLPWYVVFDSAHNLVAAVSCTNWTNTTCFVHMLQPCTQGFQTLCLRARPILGQNKCSSHARAQYLEIQRNMGAEALEVAPTMWSCEFFMLSHLLELRPVIAAHLAVLMLASHCHFWLVESICLYLTSQAIMWSNNFYVLCNIPHSFLGHSSSALCADIAGKTIG